MCHAIPGNKICLNELARVATEQFNKPFSDHSHIWLGLVLVQADCETHN